MKKEEKHLFSLYFRNRFQAQVDKHKKVCFVKNIDFLITFSLPNPTFACVQNGQELDKFKKITFAVQPKVTFFINGFSENHANVKA